MELEQSCVHVCHRMHVPKRFAGSSVWVHMHVGRTSTMASPLYPTTIYTIIIVMISKQVVDENLHAIILLLL